MQLLISASQNSSVIYCNGMPCFKMYEGEVVCMHTFWGISTAEAFSFSRFVARDVHVQSAPRRDETVKLYCSRNQYKCIVYKPKADITDIIEGSYLLLRLLALHC